MTQTSTVGIASTLRDLAHHRLLIGAVTASLLAAAPARAQNVTEREAGDLLAQLSGGGSVCKQHYDTTAMARYYVDHLDGARPDPNLRTRYVNLSYVVIGTVVQMSAAERVEYCAKLDRQAREAGIARAR